MKKFFLLLFALSLGFSACAHAQKHNVFSFADNFYARYASLGQSAELYSGPSSIYETDGDLYSVGKYYTLYIDPATLDVSRAQFTLTFIRDGNSKEIDIYALYAFIASMELDSLANDDYLRLRGSSIIKEIEPIVDQIFKIVELKVDSLNHAPVYVGVDYNYAASRYDGDMDGSPYTMIYLEATPK